MEMDEIQSVMQRCDRAITSECGLAAAHGHTKGTPPQYCKYEGNEVLYHMTTENNARQIMSKGIERMNRRFIHLSKTLAKKSKRRNVVICLKAADLRNKGLVLLQSNVQEVVLCEGPIPPTIIQKV